MERPRLTQQEAATAAGVSLSTIRRRRADGSFPGARLDPVRGWLIPVEDLLAAGFRLNAPARADEQLSVSGRAGAASTPSDQTGPEALTAHAQALSTELLAAQHRAELAEAEARHLRAQLDERGERVEVLNRLVQALTMGTAPPATEADREGNEPPVVPAQSGGHDRPPAEAGSTPPPRRRWWGRRSG
ncbi:helix-turn-helix domain-containing protein [Streptomyces sp. NPDC001889]